MFKKFMTRIKNFIEDVKDYIKTVIGCFIIGWNNQDDVEER